ncbi:Cytosolic Fe-S cluster assembly factor nar1 [Hypocenomyce scalaris]|nr:Cytosolic Fe-S cluster assembly factor nar1 [Hypocenomyce scalaris]
MSAILSADDLNDFISPGVACIKPVETLPLQKPQDNPYEVINEDKVPAENLPPAQISLTDCLACSGCVTSAEAVLVSLQSHTEVLSSLDSPPWIPTTSLPEPQHNGIRDKKIDDGSAEARSGKIFVASVSPQVRASVAATYGISERKAGWMIEQLLSGPKGLRTGGAYRNGFTWVVDTNAMREACLVIGADEVMDSTLVPENQQVFIGEGALSTQPKRPVLTSACPGWICYVEKTHPHVLPHLSRLKSPQALTGTLLKTVLSQRLNICPDRIWHVAVMPCFDKKLEASREELTDIYWRPSSTSQGAQSATPVRDVDCVITARELFMLADSRGISFPSLPQQPLDPSSRIAFPDPKLHAFLFPQNQASDFNSSAKRKRQHQRGNQSPLAGSSGGYLYHILQTYQSIHPGSSIRAERGRNADVVDYTLVRGEEVLFRAARYYGFRNIQNLVRRLRPARESRLPGGKMVGSRRPGRGKGAGEKDGEYAYVEVMACPGGCTNGGGQIKVEDVGGLKGAGKVEEQLNGVVGGQKQWLARVDEAYFSMEESDDEKIEEDGGSGDVDAEMDDNEEGAPADIINGISTGYVKGMLDHWAQSTGIELQKLVFTSYRKVESDVGKDKVGGTERVVELAGRIGGGW